MTGNLQWRGMKRMHYFNFGYRQCTEYVFVALDIRHAKRTVICGLSGCTIYFHIISQTAQFRKKSTEHKWTHFTPEKDPVPILHEAGCAPGPAWTGGISCSHRDSIPDRAARSQSLYRLSYPPHEWYKYAYLHVKYPLFFSDFNKNWIFSTVFRKILKYKI